MCVKSAWHLQLAGAAGAAQPLAKVPARIRCGRERHHVAIERHGELKVTVQVDEKKTSEVYKRMPF